MNKITTTLAEIRKHEPCADGWRKLCRNLGGLKQYGEHTPLTFKQIYDSNGYQDTLWCLGAVNEKYHNLLRHFAVDCASAVEHLMSDKRSKQALVIARKYADGLAKDEELAAARAAARGAAAWDAARDTAWAAAWAAARDAARAAGDASKAAQMRLLFLYCEHGKRPENSENLIKQFMEEKDE